MARITDQPPLATRPGTAPAELDATRSGSFDERHQRGERDQPAERSSRPELWQAPSGAMDSFAPVLEAWKQAFKSWSELAETMVKVQQEAFASMISAAGAIAEDADVSGRGKDEPAYSGSRNAASTPTGPSTTGDNR